MAIAWILVTITRYSSVMIGAVVVNALTSGQRFDMCCCNALPPMLDGFDGVGSWGGYGYLKTAVDDEKAQADVTSLLHTVSTPFLWYLVLIH